MGTARQGPYAVGLQVPLQPHEARLLGPKAEGPPSGYRNVRLHAVELARSENTCRNNQCQQCLNIRGLELGDGISSGTTWSATDTVVATALGPQHSSMSRVPCPTRLKK